MKLKSTLTLLTLSLGLSFGSASASLITFNSPMTGFTYDSDVVNAGFNTALGGGYSHISFSGAATGSGAAFSPDVTFSTIASANGGVTGPMVNGASEIGPYNTWAGILDINFNGAAVSSVGFGLVELGETMSVFDTSNNLLGSFNNVSGARFSLWGVSATAGEQIGRVQIDGGFYAIQDIEYSKLSVSTVPDGGATLGVLGLSMIGFVAFRRKFGHC